MTAEELAARCLVAADARSLPVDVLRMLRLTRGTMVFTPDQARAMGVPAEDLSALSAATPAVVFDRTTPAEGRQRIVCWLPESSPARLRRTLAHELGHIAWKHHPTGPEICHTGPQERAAEAFARDLLAPPCLLDRLRGRVDSLRALAWIFGLSAADAQRLWPRFFVGGPEKLSSLPPALEEAVAERLLGPALERLRMITKDERKTENDT